MTQDAAKQRIPWRQAYGSCAIQFAMVKYIREIQKSDDPVSMLPELFAMADEWEAFTKENYITP